MQYYTAVANKVFWMDFIEFRRKWRGKYSVSALAEDVGFSASYVWEVLNNKQHCEISTRFFCTVCEVLQVGFREAFKLVPVNTDRIYTPSRVREQLEHADPLLKARADTMVSAECHPLDMWRKRMSNKNPKKLAMNRR